MRRGAPLLAVVLLAVVPSVARADGVTPAPAKKPGGAAETAKETSIRWATYFSEACDEASERNVPILLHSLGGTYGHGKTLSWPAFRDPAYVRWANDVTVHVLAYSFEKDAKKPEPTVEVDRDGTKTTVLAAYPMFTPAEMESLLGEIGRCLTYPMKTPWVGVLKPDGKQVLVEVSGVMAKDFRAAYEAGQKKIGTPLDRPTWVKIRAALKTSMDAEVSGEWGKAVTAALEAKAAAKAVPAPLAEAVEGRLGTLVQAGQQRLSDARKSKSPEAAAKAEAKVREEFAGLPGFDAAK